MANLPTVLHRERLSIDYFFYNRRKVTGITLGLQRRFALCGFLPDGLVSLTIYSPWKRIRAATGCLQAHAGREPAVLIPLLSWLLIRHTTVKAMHIPLMD